MVNENDPQYLNHQIISVQAGEMVDLVAGTLESGLPSPYQGYVLVKTQTKIGKVSRHCLQEIVVKT